MKTNILIIDDDPGICEFITAASEACGWECRTASNAVTFWDNLTAETTHIMLDLRMPEVDGVELLRLLGQGRCNAGIILISGVGKRVIQTASDLAQALGLHVVGHLQKPFELAELELVLSRPLPILALQNGPSSADDVAIPDTDLRLALERNEFILHYQPQIDMSTGAVIGMEALVRWQHPDRGLIFPDSFISRLEAMEWIDDLGWLVATRALEEVGVFADEYGVIPTISINVSANSLLDLQFPDTLSKLARRFNIPAEKVTIEITESGLIRELSRALDVLTRLRMKNVQLSIDDFGTGYSVMQQLRKIPATELKIDRSFVQNICTNEQDRVIVLKTIEMGHELEMKIVAEGIETSEQLHLLRQIGCDTAQGYLFSRPQAPANMVSWLKEHRSKLRPLT